MATSEKEIKFIFKAVKEGRQLEDITEALKKVDSQAKKTTGTTSQLKEMFKGLLPAMGAATFVMAFKSITDAAMESEKETRILNQTLKNLGLTSKTTTQDIQAFANSLQELTGVSDEEVIRSFNDLIKVTKDVGATQELIKLAMDMSTGSGKSLTETTDALQKLMVGNAKAMKDFGIEVKEGESTVNVLNKAIQLYAGNTANFASTTESSVARAMGAFDNLKEAAGAAFLPLFGFLANIATFMLKGWTGAVTYVKAQLQQLTNLAGAASNLLRGNIAGASKAWQEGTKKNADIEKQMITDLSAIYTTNADKQALTKINLSKLSGIQTKIDVENAKKGIDATKKAAEEEKKLFDDRSARAKDYWDHQVDLANGSKEKEAKILEKSTNDVRLNAKDKLELTQKLETTNVKIEEEKAKNISDLAGSLAEGNLSSIKSSLIGQVKAWGAAEIAKALAGAPLSFGATLAAVAPITAAMAAGIATINAVQLAKGGIVTRETAAIMGEGGRKEAVIPLESSEGRKALSGMGGGVTVNVNAGAMMGKDAEAYQFAKIIQKQVKRINRRQITV